MLKLGRVTKVKVLFLVLVFVFNFDLFKFSAAILEKGLFVTEMFDSLQQGSTKGATQCELKSFVTMATYWVPVLPDIKGISGHLQRSIFIFANGALYV